MFSNDEFLIFVLSNTIPESFLTSVFMIVFPNDEFLIFVLSNTKPESLPYLSNS